MIEQLKELMIMALKTERRKSLVFSCLLGLALGAISWWQLGSPLPITEPVFAVSLMLVVGVVLLERLFVRPTDVIANSLACMGLAVPSLGGGGATRGWWSFLLVWSLLALVAAVLGSFAPKPIARAATAVEKVYKWGYVVATNLGKAMVLFSIALVIALMPWVERREMTRVGVFLVFMVLVWVTPELVTSISRYLKEEPIKEIGRVVGASSPSNFRAVFPREEHVAIGDLMRVDDTCGLCERAHPISYFGRIKNLVVEAEEESRKYTGELDIYGVYHTDDECKERSKNPLGLLEVKQLPKGQLKVVKLPGASALPDAIRVLPIFDVENRAVGYVDEGSSIIELRVHIYPHVQLERGHVLVFSSPESNAPVYYQVLDVVTDEDEETRPPYGRRWARAIQIGVLNRDEWTFSTYESVPCIHTPLERPQTVEAPELAGRIGTLPGTSIPVAADLNAMVVYHTGILGTTGSGKTTLAKTLIASIAETGVRVVVFDLHDEYRGEDVPGGALTIRFADAQIRDAVSRFLESKELANQEKILGSNLVQQGRADVKTWLEGDVFTSWEAVTDKFSALDSRRTDEKPGNKVLGYFLTYWYPREYVLRCICGLPNGQKGGVLDFVLEWYAGDVHSESPVLIIKMHNLSPDEQRWVVGCVSECIYQAVLSQGAAELDPQTRDPRARICFLLEEAQIFTPEKGYDIGIDEAAGKLCKAQIRNLALRCRKYGVGLLVCSQRSAIVGKTLLSQCNTLFGLNTVSKNDKDIFRDFIDERYVGLVTYLSAPPDSPEAIFWGKASKSRIPLIINYDLPADFS